MRFDGELDNVRKLSYCHQDNRGDNEPRCIQELEVLLDVVRICEFFGLLDHFVQLGCELGEQDSLQRKYEYNDGEVANEHEDMVHGKIAE